MDRRQTRLILIVIYCGIYSFLIGQNVTNFTEIHWEKGEKPKTGFSPEDLKIVTTGEYTFMSVTANSFYKYYVNNEPIFDLKNNILPEIEKPTNMFSLVKLSRNNEYLEHIIIHGYRSSLNSNGAGFGTINLLSKGDRIFVYGRFSGDQFYVNGEYRTDFIQKGAFFLELNEDLELVDEFYIKRDSFSFVDLSSIDVVGNELHMAGIFNWPSVGTEYYLHIGEDSIKNIDGGGCIDLSDFYAVWDLDAKKMKKGFSFGGCRGGTGSTADLKVDDNGDVTMGSRFYGGSSFDFLGHKQNAKQVSPYKTIVINMDKHDSLNYLIMNHGTNYHDIAEFGICDEGYVYEIGRIGNWGTFLNDNDTISEVVVGESESFLLKRNKSTGKVEWISMYPCTGPSGFIDMDCSSEDYIVLGGGSVCAIDNPYAIETFRGQSIVSLFDKETGRSIKDIHIMPADQTLSFELKNINLLDNGKIRIVGSMGANENPGQTYYLRIGDQIKEVNNYYSTILFDIEPFAVATEDIFNEKIEVYPNPISKGEMLSFKGVGITSKKRLYSINGQLVGEIGANGLVPDVNPGVYILAIDKTRRIKLVIL